MLNMKDLHEFFRSEYAPVVSEKQDEYSRLLIQNFIEFYNNRHAAQQSVHPTKATPRWYEVLVNKFRVLCSRLRG